MHPASYRDTWAEISLDAIEHNAHTFKKNLRRGCKLMAVVKADGYGHGAYETARAALRAGAEYLGVALLDEALELRAAGITEPVLVLGYTPPRSVKKAVEADITLTVFTTDVLEAAGAAAMSSQMPARIHLKVDTGMTRIGVRTKEEALSLARQAIQTPGVALEGIFTHFATADSEDDTFTREQFRRFMNIVDHLSDAGIGIQLRHCCNSAAAMQYPDMHLDMVRVGISLYGLLPSTPAARDTHSLQPAMQFKTRLVQVKDIEVGTPVSYGSTFVAKRPTRIGTIPAGYADGLSRLLSNRGDMLLHGKRVRIAGRVCMDQTMLDITDVKNAKEGDPVTIFGQSEDAFLPVDELAGLMGTINYEVVCLIGKRVPRVYLHHEKPVASVNKLIGELAAEGLSSR
ncbi:alanine racemase [Paenibacillus sp. UNC499MF]|uniref:alanine racemase n=1 Tax=Paenibacillus sp. UNC499MF TaxID=1502751 RepID=UPI00089FC548|nr:alanine racemase [Paenibacillus sp. UNC499MF]SEG62775.1 alanine racemase [Paenibacillus sp. UNC499MF]